MSARAIVGKYLAPGQFPVLSAAWRWWIGTLASMIPTSLRRFLTGSNARTLLRVGPSGVAEIVADTDGLRQSLGLVDLNDKEEPRAFPAHMPDSRRQVTVRLPPGSALRSTIVLPATTQRNLGQAVLFELQRQTPFRVAEILHAYRVSGRDAARKTIFVDLTVVRRREVETLMASARKLGMEPIAVEVAGDDATHSTSPDLLDHRASRRSLPAPVVATTLSSGLAILLALAAIAIPLFRDRAALEALRAEADQARLTANESVGLQKQIDSKSQEGGFLADRRRKVASVSQVLYELTKLFPDDTSLVELRVDEHGVELTGLTSSASNVIGLLNKSDYFANPSFRSSMTQDQRTGQEQFDVAVQVAPRGTP